MTRLIPLLRPVAIFGIILVYIILSLDVMSVFFPCNHYGQNYATHWEPTGEVREPPVAYRILIPTISHTIQILTPDTVKNSIRPSLIAFRDNPFHRGWLGLGGQIPDTLNDTRIVDTFIHVCVIYASLLAFIAMIYKLSRALFPNSLAYALLAPMVALLVMVPIEARYAYYYDFSNMFFTCACLYLMLKQRWISYIACLLVGIYNEETTLFMVIFYFMYFYRHLSRHQYITLGLMQVALGGGLELAIRYFTVHDIFRYALPGSTFWTDDAGQPFWVRTTLFLRAHDLTDFMHTLFLGLLLGYQWMEKPEFLRVCSWIPLVNVALYFTMCNSGEYRDLCQSIPVLVLMATHSLVRMSGADRFEWLRPKTLRSSHAPNQQIGVER